MPAPKDVFGPATDDNEDRDEEIRIRRIRKKKKEPGASTEKSSGGSNEQGGRLRQFFQNLGPALAAMQLPDPNEAVGPVPQRGLGSALRGLNLAGQSYTGAREAIREANKRKTIDKLRASPAYQAAVSKMNAGEQLSGTELTMLNIGLGDKFQGRVEAVGQEDAAAVATQDLRTTPEGEATRAQNQPALDASVDESKARAGLLGAQTDATRQGATADSVRADAAYNQSLASLTGAEAAMRNATTNEEQNAILRDRVTIERAQLAEKIRGNIINEHPTMDETVVGLAIDAYARNAAGLDGPELTPAQRQIVAGLPRVPQETISVRRENMFKISSDFANRMEKVAILHYKELGQEVPNRVILLINRLAVPGVLMRYSEGEPNTVDDMTELQGLIGASGSPGGWAKFGKVLLGYGNKMAETVGEYAEEDVNAAIKAGEEPLPTGDNAKEQIISRARARHNLGPFDRVLPEHLTPEERTIIKPRP